jgi:hypothetical protein
MENSVTVASSTSTAVPLNSSTTVQLNDYYSLQNIGTSQYLDWMRVWGNPVGEVAAIVYSSAKDMWFATPTDGSGTLMTGAPVYLKLKYMAINQYLLAEGPGQGNALWQNSSGPDQPYEWLLYTDTAMTPGLPISLGQTIYIQSVQFPGNFLTVVPGTPHPNVVIGPFNSSNSSQAWSVQSS